MKRFGARAAVLIAPALLAVALTALAQDDGVLRVNVRLVHVLATVTDANGRPVTGLDPADFALRDNDVSQKISIFERQSAQPLSVCLLIDTSGSTAASLKYEGDAAGRFVRALFGSGNSNDKLALFSFNDEVMKQTGFTRESAPLERALGHLHGQSGTSLYDAIYLASDQLYGRDGRHVLVIVTDGGDTTSTKDYQAAVEAAQRVDAVIYPVLVIPIENNAGRNTGGENALTTMAIATGGRVFTPTLGPQLDAAFARIIEELRTQYFMAYYPHAIPPSLDRFHRIRLDVDRPGLRIASRSGYYEESVPGRVGSARLLADPR